MPGMRQPQGTGEQQPLDNASVPQREIQSNSFYKMGFVCALGVSYVICSAALIAYNKYLVHPDRFPYAICLVFLHAVFCSVFAGGLFLLVLTNTAYLHSSVAFLQMMKEANLVLVYALSLMAAMEKFSWRNIGILTFIMFATTITIHGELNFSMTGFVIQGVGQIFECCKIVLQAMLLTSAGRKLDALTYVLIVMPLCAALLGVGMGVLIAFPHSHFMTPQWHHLVQWWPHLLANACIAFVLNVVIALFVKYSSAVAFILAGILKDAMIVSAGALVFHEVVTLVQAVGFSLQLMGILVYSMIKTFPDRFQDGLIPGFSGLVFSIEPASIKGKSALGQYGSTKEDA